MSESAESPQSPFAEKWAVRFGAALLAAMTIVVVLATWDRLQRARLESATETTAVGDVKFFQPPAKLGMVVVSLEGRLPLLVSVQEKMRVRDTHVRRVAVDAASGLSIYELSAAATEEERAGVAASGDTFLLKLAPNEFAGAVER